MFLQLTTHQPKLTWFQKQTDPVPEAGTQKYSESRAYGCVYPLLINAMGWGESREIAYEGVKGKADPQAGWQWTQMLPGVSPLERRTQRNQNRTNRVREDAWRTSQLGSAEQRESYWPEMSSLAETMGRPEGGSRNNWSWNDWHLSLPDSSRGRTLIGQSPMVLAESERAPKMTY